MQLQLIETSISLWKALRDGKKPAGSSRGEKKAFAELLDMVILMQVLLRIADSVFTSQLFPTGEDIQGAAGTMIRGSEVLWVTKIHAQKNAKDMHASGMK